MATCNSKGQRVVKLPQRLSQPWFIAALALIAFGMLYVFNPAISGVFPPCPFHAFTGWHCPGCGTLRGLHQLLHGNVAEALAYNPLMVVTLPLLGMAVLWDQVRALRGQTSVLLAVPGSWIMAYAGLTVVFWILRNIPVWPFSWLAPG